MVPSGGGALLKNLDERLKRETGAPVRVADDPLGCVTVGSGRYLEVLARPGKTFSSTIPSGSDGGSGWITIEYHRVATEWSYASA
jgi:hypothetical protein